MTWLSVVYLVDLALFVLVFWIIRSRRASASLKTAVVLAAVVLYLVSLVVLIFISKALWPAVARSLLVDP